MSAFRRVRSAGLSLTMAVITAGAVGLALAGPAQAATQSAAKAVASKGSAVKGADAVPLCGDAPKGQARCFALRRTDVAARKGAQPSLTVAGFGPADLTSAYSLPANGGGGQTVAIVDAFDDPNAEADLATYRSQFGLPACTTANGCFSKVSQRGGTDYPAPDAGWAGEISLDLDMVSAVAPLAHILLVEADDNFTDNLAASVDEAVALGAKYVSNSYGSGYDSTPGSGEDPSEVTDFDAHYNHPGVAVVASTGDSDYGVSYPAASQYVTSVGGTSLVADGSARGWSESVWHNGFGGPGSGCSLYEAKPSWQTDSGCSLRMEADVSAVADPQTGVSVYDSYQSGGWGVFGGTSASAPIIAAVFADAGTPTPGTYPSSYPYLHPSSLNDVTTGANGSCSPAYYCTAGTGYDGPTGLGTPSGLVAFANGPHGQVSGTVTDATTHAAIVGASVDTGTGSTITDAAGHYALTLPADTYDLTVSAYGYATGTLHGVAVPDGGAVTADLALTPLPRATVSGKITDASGHGWPLYATVTADGVPGGPVFTNPYTGKYTLSLPRNASYTLHVTANYPGYVPQTTTVALGSANIVRNVGVPIDDFACTAPGYVVQTTGATQPFDGATTPAGWSVTNNTAAGGWTFTDSGQRGNLTGGSGGFAILDSDYLGIGNTEDSYLTSPVTDFSAAPHPVVSFDSDYRDLVSVAKVDVTTNGGASWTTVWDHSGSNARGPSHVIAQLTGAAGHAGVQVRFHYTGTWAWWWEVDNVFVGNRDCAQVSGGLVAGVVNQGGQSAGLVGATVTSNDQPAEGATTAATPSDPNLSDGFYWMFSSLTGKHPFTAALTGYSPVTKVISVKENGTLQSSFALGAPKLKVSPVSISKTVTRHGTGQKLLTVKNQGAGVATVTLAVDPAVSWLSLGQTTLTLAKGASAQVAVTFNAATADVTGPGTYSTAITVTSNAPAVPPVPVTMTVQP